jgi:hypothetical protein
LATVAVLPLMPMSEPMMVSYASSAEDVGRPVSEPKPAALLASESASFPDQTALQGPSLATQMPNLASEPVAGGRHSAPEKMGRALFSTAAVPDRIAATRAAIRPQRFAKGQPFRVGVVAKASNQASSSRAVGSGISRPSRPAQWRVETVQRHNYGVLAPGWVVADADAAAADTEHNGEVQATPVMLDIRIPTEAIFNDSAVIPASHEAIESSTQE